MMDIRAPYRLGDLVQADLVIAPEHTDSWKILTHW